MNKGQGLRMIPEYLLDFMKDTYIGKAPDNYGRILVPESFVKFIEGVYRYYSLEVPRNKGNRLVPEYLYDFFKDVPLIYYTDDEIKYQKIVPNNVFKFAEIKYLGGMSYKVEVEGEYVIQNSPVTSIKINDEVVRTIPEAVQSLEGYGWGINDSCYNYVDIDNKKFVKKVGKYTFTGNENFVLNGSWVGVRAYEVYFSTAISISNTDTEIRVISNSLESYSANYVINNPAKYSCSIISNKRFIIKLEEETVIDDIKDFIETYGLTIYYELATPVETDISDYIDDNFRFLEVHDGDVITFENEYQNDVPSEIEYLVEV